MASVVVMVKVIVKSIMHKIIIKSTSRISCCYCFDCGTTTKPQVRGSDACVVACFRIPQWYTTILESPHMPVGQAARQITRTATTHSCAKNPVGLRCPPVAATPSGEMCGLFYAQRQQPMRARPAGLLRLGWAMLAICLALASHGVNAAGTLWTENSRSEAGETWSGLATACRKALRACRRGRMRVLDLALKGGLTLRPGVQRAAPAWGSRLPRHWVQSARMPGYTPDALPSAGFAGMLAAAPMRGASSGAAADWRRQAHTRGPLLPSAGAHALPARRQLLQPWPFNVMQSLAIFDPPTGPPTMRFNGGDISSSASSGAGPGSNGSDVQPARGPGGAQPQDDSAHAKLKEAAAAFHDEQVLVRFHPSASGELLLPSAERNATLSFYALGDDNAACTLSAPYSELMPFTCAGLAPGRYDLVLVDAGGCASMGAAGQHGCA